MTEVLHRVPKYEIDKRLFKLRETMNNTHEDWSMILINNKINMYYFTGTMQDGVLVIRPNDATLWVRRDLERAKNESFFEDIKAMKSFRTLSEFYTDIPKTAFIEIKTATVDWTNLINKYMNFEKFLSVDKVVSYLRSYKSEYEINHIKSAGKIHAEVLGELLPQFAHEGMSEAEVASKIFHEMLIRGGHGIARYNQPLSEDVVGYVSFGKSALQGTGFDGPGGIVGTCTAVQTIGSHANKLAEGMLIYVDCPCGVEGYHTDKSVVVYFGDLSKDENADLIKTSYDYCKKLEQEICKKFVVGATLSDVYNDTMKELDENFAKGFMNGSKFLGHSVGLTVDEAPVIANGFNIPIEENMIFAIEPKIALEGMGMVGTENTYLVTKDGVVNLTGNTKELIEIK